MQGYQSIGMQIRLRRVEAGLHQKTLGTLLGGATQALVSWWESGLYMPGDRYLGRLKQFLELDPLALRSMCWRLDYRNLGGMGIKSNPQMKC